jgi:hypothetical protein
VRAACPLGIVPYGFRKDHELKLSVFIAGSALTAGLIGSAVTFTPPVFAASAQPVPVMQNVTNDPPLTHPMTIEARTMAVRTTVPAFNDGFSDAKLDDCEQGFQSACAWLHHAPAGHTVKVPAWLHMIRAPRSVARDACGRWPQFGLGKDKRGQIVPGEEIWPAGPGWRSDGIVFCASGFVAQP